MLAKSLGGLRARWLCSPAPPTRAVFIHERAQKKAEQGNHLHLARSAALAVGGRYMRASAAAAPLPASRAPAGSARAHVGPARPQLQQWQHQHKRLIYSSSSSSSGGGAARQPLEHAFLRCAFVPGRRLNKQLQCSVTNTSIWLFQCTVDGRAGQALTAGERRPRGALSCPRPAQSDPPRATARRCAAPGRPDHGHICRSGRWWGRG